MTQIDFSLFLPECVKVLQSCLMWVYRSWTTTADNLWSLWRNACRQKLRESGASPPLCCWGNTLMFIHRESQRSQEVKMIYLQHIRWIKEFTLGDYRGPYITDSNWDSASQKDYGHDFEDLISATLRQLFPIFWCNCVWSQIRISFKLKKKKIE